MSRAVSSAVAVSVTSGMALAAFAVSGCCFGGVPGSGPAPMPVTPPPPVGIAPPPPPGGAMITVAPGFVPDPTTQVGNAGGPVPASTLSPGCYGSVPAAPQLTLRVVAPMPSLVVVVESTSDTTLVIRRPDGTYLCDDDGGAGLNPRVQGAFAPGDYAVYVGVFGSAGAAPYALGVTTIAAMDAHVVTGTPIRVGRFRVVSATGATGIQPGALCDYVQVGIAEHPAGYDVRWRVACSGVAIYGESGGFQYRQRAEWPAGTVIRDAATTATDNDPLFTWDASGIHIADDAMGHQGVYDFVLEDVPLPS